MTTEALEQIIGRLINESGNFAEVEKVCRQFKHESSELVLARTIASLAERTLTPADMPESIKALYEERYGPKNFDDYDLNELAELLDRLVGLSHHAKQFCERIVVKYKVCHALLTDTRAHIPPGRLLKCSRCHSRKSTRKIPMKCCDLCWLKDPKSTAWPNHSLSWINWMPSKLRTC